jgi:YHS domain-containing protein
MSWVLRIIVILIIVRLLWRMIMGPIRRPRHERRPPGSMPLVRDPVCGTYLLPERAIKTGSGDSTLYFCSEACRAKYHDRTP